jgi:hypothetical protein
MSALKIEFPEEYTLEEANKKIKKKINRLSKKGLEKISEFIGTSSIEAMFYLYLLKKYKSPCFLIEATSGDFWEILGINLKIREIYSADESEHINSYLERLAAKLVECIKNNVNIIIIPLGLTLYFSDGTTDGHANVLIYRKAFNHIEHFEPHGKTGSFGNEKLNSSIDLFLKLFVEYVNIELFKNKTPHQVQDIKPIELIESNQVCPYFYGFQTYEEESSIIKNLEVESGGYCAAWSMFFTELCLKNPSMTSNQIITSVFSTALFKMSTEDYFRHVIRGYATFINEKISTYFTFLLDKKIDMADTTKMSRIEQTKLKDALKIIINIEMLLTINPNALDDKMHLLQFKMNHRNNLDIREYNNTKLELSVLEKYKERMNDFNSPINTPSSFTPINTKKTKSRKIKEIKKEEKICPSGKELNPKTNRCIKSKPVSIMKIIRDKKKKLEEELSKKTKECPPDKELNQVTGRCNKIKTKTIKKKKESLNNPKECPHGKELNTKTNRCVKIKNKTIKIKIN